MIFPKVSVIIPIYNAERHLRQCLDSIVEQTLHNIEIICVDDGSTDTSLDILREYADKDDRFFIIRQQNQFAGMARNNGMQHAKGTYLAFFDADDFFEPDMLEKAYDQCEQDQADLCLWSADYYDTNTGLSTPFDYCLDRALIPPTLPFSVQDMPDCIFQISAPTPWNKLYRRSMLEKHQLLYPSTKRSEDTFFASMAMYHASRITIVDKPFVHYRQAHGGNQQSGTDLTPLDWYHVMLQLKEALQSKGGFDFVYDSYLKLLIGNGHYYMFLMRSWEGFQSVYANLSRELQHEQTRRPNRAYALPKWYADIFRHLTTTSQSEYLLHELKQQTAACDALNNQIAQHVQALQTLKQENIVLQTLLRNSIRRQYRKYRLLSHCTFGAMRRRYRRKKTELKAKLASQSL
ncbi:glycosyltransferase family 2 protein [Akkermansia glycaniphila]|uniref:Nucleotide-diphospho-sugar transferases n=1 Tax=Akkermansia glycaniphila TaxID=1679444 RepID=A0A1H6MGU7_9BACT|nr:glycosyltransferase [Akkermansia glycaniphila]SEH98465.1 nucleotide-diphospho-sugar transferases [Akkermansia glycaniphila]